MRISPGPSSSYVASRRHGSGGHLDAHRLPTLSCPLRHQDLYSIVLPGLLIFLPVSLMLIVVYGLWKKRHRGSEYNPLSRPPGRGGAEHGGLTHLPKRLTALCPQVVCHHLHPATRTAQPSGEGGGWGEGRQAGTAWHDPLGLTWQEAEGRARRGVDWPWQEPCPSASLSLSSQATGCATILLDPGGTHLEDWSLHGSLLGLRQLNYGLREGGAFGGQRRMKTGACLNWNPAEGRGLAQGWTQASPEPEAALRPLSPLGLPGAWDSPQIGGTRQETPGEATEGNQLRAAEP